jgi:GLPGLI family protein
MNLQKKVMKRRVFFSLIVIASMVCWPGCGPRERDDNRISEGVILYDAELVDTNSPMADMMPNKMTVKFKNNKTIVQMSAGMGLLTMSFISDPETKTFTQVVKFTGSPGKAAIQNADEIQKENELFNIEIIPSNETKMIAGYNCKKARIHYKGGDPADFDIYYTTELNIKNSNFSNPYYKLDGVLMEYRIKKAGLEMQFVATSVTKEPVEDAVFQISPDVKVISPEEMTDIFNELQ